MDDPSENYDPDNIEEAEDPIGRIGANEYDDDDDDELPEFVNDENKKLHQLVKEKERTLKKIKK